MQIKGSKLQVGLHSKGVLGSALGLFSCVDLIDHVLRKGGWRINQGTCKCLTVLQYMNQVYILIFTYASA